MNVWTCQRFPGGRIPIVIQPPKNIIVAIIDAAFDEKMKSLDESFCEKKLVTIFAPVAVFIFIVVIVFFIFRHRKKRIHRAGQTQVLTDNEAQAYQNYQAPPPYQPEESYYPPPEYEEHQSEMSASYHPATIREDEPPPPYSAEQQGESGGQVRASETS